MGWGEGGRIDPGLNMSMCVWGGGGFIHIHTHTYNPCGTPRTCHGPNTSAGYSPGIHGRPAQLALRHACKAKPLIFAAGDKAAVIWRKSASAAASATLSQCPQAVAKTYGVSLKLYGVRAPGREQAKGFGAWT